MNARDQHVVETGGSRSGQRAVMTSPTAIPMETSKKR